MPMMLGKRPPDHSRPALSLGLHLTPTFQPPLSADWMSRVRTWQMYGNDRYGDCVWAMMGHALKAWTTYAGQPVRVPQSALLQGYSDVTGFDRNNPATDQGTVLQDALGYWRTHGIAGHKILAFAKVDHRNVGEMRSAIDIFGALMVGIEFPATAMDQFRARRPWDVVHPDGGIEGGHAIHVGRYAPGSYDLSTWGRAHRMSLAFAQTYVDEAWVVITPEWVTSTGKTPEGLDLAGLGAQFATLTGEADPFG